MSEERFKKIHDKLDDHGEKISKLETGHAINDERHKRHDKRIFNLESIWSWIIKVAITGIIGALVSMYLKSGGFT